MFVQKGRFVGKVSERRVLPRGLVAVLLVILSVFLIIQPVSAATADIIPDSIVSRSGFGTGVVTDVDEGRTANTADIISTGTGGAAGDNITFSFGTVSSVESATQLVLGVNMSAVLAGAADTVDIDLKVNGTTVATQAVTITTSYTWYTATATGSWNQSETDSITATVTRSAANGTGPGNSRDDDVRIASLYTEVTYTQAVEYTQSAYRWYANQDGVQPGSALANANTAHTITAGALLRLRLGLDVGLNNLASGATKFKLQYATSTSGPWTNVSNTGTPEATSAPTSKLTNPGTLPAGTGAASAFSPDGTYLSVAHSNSPYVTIYKRSGDTFTKLSDPATLPTGDGGGAAWSPDGVYMAIAHGSSPYITIYKRSGDTFTKLSDPATLPTGSGNEVTFSSDGVYMAVAHGSSPFVTIYKRSGDTFTKLTNPATLPTGIGYGVAFSPDTTYMSVGHFSSPYVTIYKRSGDTFTKLANPSTLPGGDAPGVTFSPDGTYMATADGVSPYVTIYKRSGDTFTKLANPSTLPAGAGQDVEFSPDTKYLTVGHANTSFMTTYERSGDTFTKLSDPGTLPPAIANGVTFSSTGLYLSVTHNSSPYISIYKSPTSTQPEWKYNDNATPADGATISSALLSGTPILQSYTETNPTALNPNAVNISQRGEWDFSLDSADTSPSTTYYFRMTRSDNTILTSYTAYPQITTSSGANTAPNAPSSSAQKETDDTAIATGGWKNSTSIKFTASLSDPDASDTLQLCVEADLIANAFSGTEDSCGTGVAYSGTAVSANVTLALPTDPGEYHWQARVKDSEGSYSSWVSYDVNAETARDLGIDTTAPTGGTVNDGLSTDTLFNDGSLSSLSANWSGFNSDLSGLSKYEYSIGTTAGGTTVKGWTDVGTAVSITANSLTLQTSNKYFFNVRATDNAGNTSIVSSNGQLVAPTVSFTVSPSTITFANLNAGNSFTDTKTTTLTTSTNAYGGYIVRSYVTDLLRSANNSTISNFSGGSYASPDDWQPGDTGFGYTSSDTSVQGVDKYQPATCPGGNTKTSPGCYAPFTTSGPGEIVVDHTANLSGTPLTNQQFTVTYRTTTTNTQAASRYTTSIVYTITPIY